MGNLNRSRQARSPVILAHEQIPQHQSTQAANCSRQIASSTGGRLLMATLPQAPCRRSNAICGLVDERLAPLEGDPLKRNLAAVVHHLRKPRAQAENHPRPPLTATSSKHNSESPDLGRGRAKPASSMPRRTLYHAPGGEKPTCALSRGPRSRNSCWSPSTLK